MTPWRLDSRLYWNVDYYFGGWGSLGDIGRAMMLEVLILIAGFLFYPCFMAWLHLRKLSVLFDPVFGLMYVCMFIGTFPTLWWAKGYFKLPPFVVTTLAIEQLRFCMKTYSFVRENAYKVLYPWSKDDKTGPAVWYEGQMSPKVGSFRQYIYFLFCPTLLYRDHYPRNSGPVNWQKAIIYLACFIISLLIVLPFFSRYLYPKSLHWKELVHCFIVAIPPGFAVSTLASICVMHGWMNFGAEITGFADREFYSDWWNSTIFTEFYRKWNNIPHHFIHDYLYNDVRKVTRFKPLVLFVPLFASSIIHEYVIGVTMGVFIPILTVMFAGVGVFVAFIWPPKHMRIIRQSFFISSLSVGVAAILVCSMIEQKARELCPHEEESLLDIFMPRVIECFSVYN
ncbi:PREDICTED: sterol O-acyltransferase 1-like isoform X2 [Amphimedon queenslandica]|uniref:O-acyltransferase n=1 Tax=Amphimedon queenslandica TaxID=400682 RepID=A0AAN0J3D5_AMPQE|nr:PREDICTED: sterol O-acyltransferase 1-like isoform X2 [Amphimedon queenslandica]|eukprot:XP_019851232.1 PREDICTED: sterol O-acyltransferase 1-like isoform X2 [Amphimedon queenslandica]